MSDTTGPREPTRRGLSRRAFSLLSGATAAFGASVASAAAQGTGFGGPHRPIVAEDDPAITVARPPITSGERTLASYAAAPRGAGSVAGVVVVQAIWGVDAQLRDTVRRLAKEGYAAIAPDLYAGLGAPSGDGATDVAPFREVAAKLVDATVDADLAAAAASLRATAGNPKLRVGVLGFCMGGGIALRQGVDGAASFAATAVFYGKVRYGTGGNAGAITPIALAYADRLTVPLVGSWGGRDTSIVPADVLALDAALTKRNAPHDIEVYAEAGHAFFDDTRDSYVASAAAGAWTRTLIWFGRHLQ